MKWLKTNKSSRQKLQYQSCIAIASSFVRFIHFMWYTTWQFVQHIVIAKDCTFFLHIPHLLCSAILLCIDKHEQDRYSGTCNIVSGFSKKYRYCHICVVSWITMKEAWIQYYYQFSVSFENVVWEMSCGKWQLFCLSSSALTRTHCYKCLWCNGA